ncbi:hypothetical protein HKD37_20G057109 [Glycine soja]
MPPHTNTADPSDNPKNVQTNLSIPPHRKHVQVTNHVPVLQNSSDLKETGSTELDDPIEEGFVQHHAMQNFLRCKEINVMDVLETKLNKASVEEIMRRNNISNRVELAEAEYNNVLNSLKQNPQDPSLLALANRTRGHTIMLRKTESMKFAQLIKNKYLLQADKCSKFFHALIKRNRHSRFIAAIRLEDGHNTSSQDEIALAFVFLY